MDKLKNNKIYKNKVLYINDVICSKNLKFIDGKKELDSICEKFRNFDSINLEIFINLNVNFCDY